MTNFNGWKNRETWNVALWLNNDPGLYELAKDCRNYEHFLDVIGAKERYSQTSDGINWNSKLIDIKAMDRLITSMRGDS